MRTLGSGARSRHEGDPESVGCSSRRDFLKQTGAAVAGVAVMSRSAMAVNTAPKKVRIGVVGGRFGCSFQWHEHPDCIV
ncbi:MAG: twin-arginine translocation signal domain-containing protein, partial [Planctomycetota bacterium]